MTHDGLHGTQSIYYDSDNPADQIKFALVTGLMTFEISKSSMDDIYSMPNYWLTANNKWQPGSFNDDDPTIPHNSKGEDIVIIADYDCLANKGDIDPP